MKKIILYSFFVIMFVAFSNGQTYYTQDQIDSVDMLMFPFPYSFGYTGIDYDTIEFFKELTILGIAIYNESHYYLTNYSYIARTDATPWYECVFYGGDHYQCFVENGQAEILYQSLVYSYIHRLRMQQYQTNRTRIDSRIISWNP